VNDEVDVAHVGGGLAGDARGCALGTEVSDDAEGLAALRARALDDVFEPCRPTGDADDADAPAGEGLETGSAEPAARSRDEGGVDVLLTHGFSFCFHIRRTPCLFVVISSRLLESCYPMGTARFLADNLRQLRQARGLTQDRVALSAGLPRPTYANLESGDANPTLSVITRVASALQVSIEELLSPPRAAVRLYKKGTLPVRTRGEVRVQELLPDALPGLSLERMDLPAGARMKGTPHVPGTREYLACERGTVELVASGEVFRLDEGDAVVFRGDQPHSYRNPGSTKAVAYSAIVLSAG
jgi:transcriptional regulator with XRE-family HTH domain